MAVAMAPSVIAAGRDSTSGASRWNTISAASTSSAATSACTTPMTNAWRPVCCSALKRNSLPMENAMKPSAMSEMISSDSSSS